MMYEQTENGKQADDLPAHAMAIMKNTLDLCGDVFPHARREDLMRTFVDCYFNQQDCGC